MLIQSRLQLVVPEWVACDADALVRGMWRIKSLTSVLLLTWVECNMRGVWFGVQGSGSRIRGVSSPSRTYVSSTT